MEGCIDSDHKRSEPSTTWRTFNTLESIAFRRVFACVFLLSQRAVPSFKQGPSMNQPSLQQEMSTYADVKARCARIVTRLEAIATDPNATPTDLRDLFIRLELLSYELQGATFRVRECWWPTSNG